MDYEERMMDDMPSLIELKERFSEYLLNIAYTDFDPLNEKNDFSIKKEKLWNWILENFTPKVSPFEARVMPESNGQIKYAIKHKDKLMLMQVSNSEKELDEKIDQAYYLRRNLQPRGLSYTKEYFMKDMQKVKITIETIEW